MPSSNNLLVKGSLSTILLNLFEKHGRMYGYEVGKRLTLQGGKSIKITEAALYQALHRLEAEGLLDSAVEAVGNRSRKYYVLTKKGKNQYKILIQDLQDFITQMQQVLNLKMVENGAK